MDKEMLLEKFIQNKLTEVEQEEFNRRYAADENFKIEVDFHNDISKVTETEDDDSFREMLSDFESEALLKTKGDDKNRNASPDFEPKTNSEKTTVKRLPMKWLIAASITLIAGLTYFFIPDSHTSSQELFTQNFEPYPNVVHPIVRGEAGPEPETIAFLAYQNGEYTSALALITELYAETENLDYLFYQANLLLQLNRGQEAIPLLQLQFSDKLSTKTTWYLAMAYLQVDDLDKAEKMLQTVVDEDEFKVEEAKNLLKLLKKLPPE